MKFNLSKKDIIETIEANEVFFLKEKKLKQLIQTNKKWDTFFKELKSLYQQKKQMILNKNFNSLKEYGDFLRKTFDYEEFSKELMEKYPEETTKWLSL